MPLSTILKYQAFPLPPKSDAVSLKNIPLCEEEIKASVNQFKGTPTMIPDSDLPAWYYLLLFKQLYPLVPEIIVEVQQGFYLVLHTIYNDSECTRPESVHLFSDLLETVPAPIKNTTKEINFDLTTIPEINSSNLKSIIAQVKKQVQDTDQVMLSGNTDPISALIAYVLWRQQARNITYSFGSKRIAL